VLASAYEPNNFVYRQRIASFPGLGSRLMVAGWLGLIGVLNLFYAISVIAGSDIFITSAAWLVSDAEPWGGLMLAVALIQLLAVPAVVLGRLEGLVIAVISAIAHLVVAAFFIFDESIPIGIILVFIDLNVLGAAAIAIEQVRD
jgi:hypothetical protein